MLTDEEREAFLKRVFLDFGPEPPAPVIKPEPPALGMAERIMAAFMGRNA